MADTDEKPTTKPEKQYPNIAANTTAQDILESITTTAVTVADQDDGNGATKRKKRVKPARFWMIIHFITSNPGVPSRLFSNRTSAGGYILAFVSSVLLQTAGYFLPVYFQAVVGTTVMDSGLYFLPFAMGTLFTAAVGGIAMSHLGVYRPVHVVSFALSAVGFGLFTLLRPDTPKVAWAWYELVLVFGLGPTISTVLPSILAGLPQSDVVAATAVFSFIKTFGFVWGVLIRFILFDGVFENNLPAVSDASLLGQLTNGEA
ncbi:major facilitator superfamily domain-containing protein [Podospora didyma]|uniref:Major facilitator superfamily domain-containing protein n=1 Tax=Podospora didyma TaxID=330526 RepID=A0AAE0NPM9_9PEZI|nr:major facilitator superfamily domain-containing protein [Podospora didyma]